MAEYQWLTTAPNPRVRATGFDAGQRGWKLHAVKATPETELKAVRFEPAACGLTAAHGWDLDLYIDQPCASRASGAETRNLH